MADANKVKFGIEKCYYSVIEISNGEEVYSTPVALPGAVNLNLESDGADDEKFYADNIVYYNAPGTNGGYSGDLELAYIPDSFRTDVLGDVTDTNGLLVEDADATPKRFALLAEFSGDANKTRHVFYNCTAKRPAAGSATIEETRSPQTETISITAIAQTFGDRHLVKAKANPSAQNWSTWFTTVQIPSL